VIAVVGSRRLRPIRTSDVEGCRHVLKLSVPSVRMRAATEQFDAILSECVPARHVSSNCLMSLSMPSPFLPFAIPTPFFTLTSPDL
jgi:hypothetical protein